MDETYKVAAKNLAENFAQGPLRPEELKDFVAKHGAQGLQAAKDLAQAMGVDRIRCMALKA